MLHEALMLEIYRQALNAGALPTARPRSTESANSSERCPSHDSNSSDNGGGQREASSGMGGGSGVGVLPVVPTTMHSTFPAVPQSLPAQPPSMEAYLHMVAAAAQQYGFPLAAAAAGPRLPLPLPNEAAAPFKLPPQASPTASSNNSEALDFRTNLFGRAESAEPPASEEEEEYDDGGDGANNPLDLSVGPRKRSAESNQEPDSSIGQIQVKKIFKTSESPPASHAAAAAAAAAAAPLLPGVNPYLAAVAAANIFRAGQFPDWNGKSDLVVDPLEKMSDIVKGGGGVGNRKEKSIKMPPTSVAAPPPPTQMSNSNTSANSSSGGSGANTAPTESGVTKARHNIWQSHWQNKGVASSVFRCVWCKQSFPTLEALTTHMKDSKHCGVNVPPFGNLPSNNDRHHHQPPPAPPAPREVNNSGSHGLRKQGGAGHNNNSPSANVKNAFQYRGDPPTPLPRKLVRGQNVWLGKGVEQAMQILKCMRCGESFRSLGEMTKHMQETQHYTNILSQEQTINMKSSASASGGGNSGSDHKDGQNSLSSEESRTLSAVLTCKVCDKAFNSLGDLSNHMAKNNHYAEPLLQSMGGGAAGSRKRPAPKKREKSLPVRKLLEMKGAQQEELQQQDKMQVKRMTMDGTGLGPSGDKTEALFAERMRQYIAGVKSPEEMAAKAAAAQLIAAKANKSPELEPKNGTNKAAAGGGANAGASSVLSAIEQMFTTSFDTPPRHASLPATSPSNSSTKNTSPVASSILKRLGIDETVDYNKPLIDTSDPYFQHYRYTSSERSGSECSAETHAEAARKLDAPTPTPEESKVIKQEPQVEHSTQPSPVKMEIKSELSDEQEEANELPAMEPTTPKTEPMTVNGSYTNNNNNNVERPNSSPKSAAASPQSLTNRNLLPPRSPADSQRSATPKSPASSHKSYDGSETKKYPSDSLNALSSMFDSLGSSSSTNAPGANTRSKLAAAAASSSTSGMESPENLSATNSLAALRQFCVKKEKTA
ncbi:protein teashirt [Scaptodrosophila lebanonensis]|uniref:Protein teashirt n=1 Tax=Drosophila lebanonensis TaxID=7225 RepID=A0A6J2TKU4_DROLE|nr:protein teashirt [Scaptodrosophila lebanonensis]